MERTPLTGGSSDYYKVRVDTPTTPDNQPYLAECNDIIEALGMTFAEGNAFKAIWRMAAARQGNGKPGVTALYDAEKVEFFGRRMVAQCKAVRQVDVTAQLASGGRGVIGGQFISNGEME